MSRLGMRLAAALFAAILLPGAVPAPALAQGEAPAPTFQDIAGHWAQAAIERLAAAGIVQGVGGGRFSPDAPLSTAAFIKIVAGVLQLPPAPLPAGTPPQYAAHWLAAGGFLGAALEAGLVRAEDFAPGGPAPADLDQPAPRGYMALLAARALQGRVDATPYLDDAPDVADAPAVREDEWAAVRVAMAAGILKGYEDGTFRADRGLTRAEGATVAVRLMDFLAAPALPAPAEGQFVSPLALPAEDWAARDRAYLLPQAGLPLTRLRAFHAGAQAYALALRLKQLWQEHGVTTSTGAHVLPADAAAEYLALRHALQARLSFLFQYPDMNYDPLDRDGPYRLTATVDAPPSPETVADEIDRLAVPDAWKQGLEAVLLPQHIEQDGFPNGFSGYANVDRVTIGVTQGEEALRNTVAHEVGHWLEFRMWGASMGAPGWQPYLTLRQTQATDGSEDNPEEWAHNPLEAAAEDFREAFGTDLAARAPNGTAFPDLREDPQKLAAFRDLVLQSTSKAPSCPDGSEQLTVVDGAPLCRATQDWLEWRADGVTTPVSLYIARAGDDPATPGFRTARPKDGVARVSLGVDSGPGLYRVSASDGAHGLGMFYLYTGLARVEPRAPHTRLTYVQRWTSAAMTVDGLSGAFWVNRLMSGVQDNAYQDDPSPEQAAAGVPVDLGLGDGAYVLSYGHDEAWILLDTPEDPWTPPAAGPLQTGAYRMRARTATTISGAVPTRYAFYWVEDAAGRAVKSGDIAVQAGRGTFSLSLPPGLYHVLVNGADDVDNRNTTFFADLLLVVQ